MEQLARARLDSGGPAFVPAAERLDRAVGKLRDELQGLARLVDIANAVRYVASAADELLQLAAKAIPLRAGVALQRPFEKPGPAKRT